MKAVFLIGCLVSSFGLGLNDYLVWGQVRAKGFAFVGKPENVRDQCVQWMEGNKIRTVRSLWLRGALVDFKKDLYASEACEAIFSVGVSLGNPQKTRFVSGEIRAIPFSFTGISSSIVSACSRYLILTKLESAQKIQFGPETVSYDHTLRGLEICGEIASRGEILDAPFDPYYVTGTVEQKGFAFVGPREILMDSCNQFMVGAGVQPVGKYLIEDTWVELPEPLKKAALCDSIFAHATRIPNSVARFEARGQIRNHPFWFVGPPTNFIQACDHWMRSEKILTVREMQLGTETLRFDIRADGSGLCGLILKRAEPIEDSSPLILAWGRAGNEGFAFGGAEEIFLQRCALFLKLSRLRLVSRLRVAGKEVRLTEPAKDARICSLIRDHGTLEEPPFFHWTVTGKIKHHDFWFRGGKEEILNQCSLFSLKHKLKGLSEIELFNQRVPLEPPSVGAEVCGAVMEQAKQANTESKRFIGGQVAGHGYSFVGSHTEGELACQTFLSDFGIQSAHSIRVFEREFSYPIPLGPMLICEQIFKQAIEFLALPDVKLEAEIGQFKFSGEGNLQVVNSSCRQFVKDNGIENVERVKVNGEMIQSNLGPWNRDEICANALLKALTTQNAFRDAQ